MNAENSQSNSENHPPDIIDNNKRIVEYKTLNEQVISRSSNLWTIASIFIPVSWLVFTYCVINFDKIDMGSVSLLALASLSSILFVCFYNTHINYMNSVSHYGLKKLEKDLGICVHRFQSIFTGTIIRKIAKKIIYVLSFSSFLAWLFLGLASSCYWPTFKIIVALPCYLWTVRLLPSWLNNGVWYLYNSWFRMDLPINFFYFAFIIVGLLLILILFFKEKVKGMEEENPCDECTLRKNSYCGKYKFQLSRTDQTQINLRRCQRCFCLLIKRFFSCLRSGEWE